METIRKNAPRQQNRVDYMFLAILLLYLFVFLGTLQCRAAKGDATDSITGVVFSGHASIDGFGNPRGTAVA